MPITNSAKTASDPEEPVWHSEADCFKTHPARNGQVLARSSLRRVTAIMQHAHVVARLHRGRSPFKHASIAGATVCFETRNSRAESSWHHVMQRAVLLSRAVQSVVCMCGAGA